LLMMTILR